MNERNKKVCSTTQGSVAMADLNQKVHEKKHMCRVGNDHMQILAPDSGRSAGAPNRRFFKKLLAPALTGAPT